MSSPRALDLAPVRPGIHGTADIEGDALVGPDTTVWALTQIRSGARVGSECNIGRNVFIDTGVSIGDRCKIQNNASLHEGVELHDGVFVGPAVVFTNDRSPRAITATGDLKTTSDWTLEHTEVHHGAAIGAGAIVIAGITIGRWAMVGAGSIVTRDVPDHGLVVGAPARLIGYVSAGGVRCATLDAARDRTASEGTDVATSTT